MSAPAVGANLERHCARCGQVTIHEFDGVRWQCATEGCEGDAVSVVTLEQFVAVEEAGADALVGDAERVLLPVNGDLMAYGDGGAGKTTLLIDLACHLAAGDDWLGIPIGRPASVLIIEAEGPRPLLRAKLRRKLHGWQGSPLDGRVRVWEHPWARFSFAVEADRQSLAEQVQMAAVDVVIAGPLTAIGMNDAGTLQEVRFFHALVNDVRDRAGRPFASALVHHENKGGKVSGAWEGVCDTLLHVQPSGHGKTRVYVQKARWASAYHATTLHLVWADSAGFALADAPLSRPERTWEGIEQYVLAHGGCSWNVVSTNVPGKADYLRRRRDSMFDDGVLINAGTDKSFVLWHRDDPARPTTTSEVRPEGDAPGDAPASDTGGGG